MMSEKEIKKQIAHLLDIICRSPQEDEEIRVLEEVLDGESRYSIAEIEKVIDVNRIGIDTAGDLMYYLKDKKEMDKILGDL